MYGFRTKILPPQTSKYRPPQNSAVQANCGQLYVIWLCLFSCFYLWTVVLHVHASLCRQVLAPPSTEFSLTCCAPRALAPVSWSPPNRILWKWSALTVTVDSPVTLISSNLKTVGTVSVMMSTISPITFSFFSCTPRGTCINTYTCTLVALHCSHTHT